MFTLKIIPRAEKELADLPGGVRKRIVEKIRLLAGNPRPQGSAKLHGSQDVYRLRSGHYGVIYRVLDEAVTVIIIRIAHRKDAYR